jgi:hypothetical protein
MQGRASRGKCNLESYRITVSIFVMIYSIVFFSATPTTISTAICKVQLVSTFVLILLFPYIANNYIIQGVDFKVKVVEASGPDGLRRAKVTVWDTGIHRRYT